MTALQETHDTSATVTADVPKTTITASVTSIKGTDLQMRCRDFQFELGRTYSIEGNIKACERGFHACPVEHHPLSVFEFYPPAISRYWEVAQAGANHAQDTKLASAQITINIELTIDNIVRRAWDYVWSRAETAQWSTATGDRGAASATGDRGAASATGNRGAASAAGYQGAASATGNRGAASATGNRGAASATGEQGAASATGEQGAASATGQQGAASATGNRGAASATGDRGAASATGQQGAASATGQQGAAIATGYQGAASATGEQGAAIATGYRGAASATGQQGAASATGEQGAASATGEAGCAMSTGLSGQVIGMIDGISLFARELEWSGSVYVLKSIACGITGQDGLKAGTWYVCQDGKLVEFVS